MVSAPTCTPVHRAEVAGDPGDGGGQRIEVGQVGGVGQVPGAGQRGQVCGVPGVHPGHQGGRVSRGGEPAGHREAEAGTGSEDSDDGQVSP